MSLKKITNCLWFDYGVGEQAVEHYTSIFTDSKVIGKNYYPESGQDIHGAKPGSVMSISFELQGHTFLALNGGPIFKFTPANSYMVMCKDQAEVDYFWEKLGEGGEYMPCGWLNDKFGVSWQVRDRCPAQCL